MKTQLTETKFKSVLKAAGRLFSGAAWLAAAILISNNVSAQNLFVSGYGGQDDRSLDVCSGKIFDFTSDGAQSTFADPCNPSDVAFDSAGNLYVVSWQIVGRSIQVTIYKYDPNGAQTTFASGLSLPSYLVVDTAGNVFVADYNSGIIYKYTPAGARTTFGSGLYHPVGMAVDSAGNLFVADNTFGRIHAGGIYEYAPDGSRTTFAVLDPSDRPADLALDGMSGLYMADLGGNIYRYDLGILRRYPRTTFGSVPNSAQSLVWDRSGNLYAVDAGDVNGNGNAIYKFTSQAVRTPFASGQTMGETFGYVAFQPPTCCQ